MASIFEILKSSVLKFIYCFRELCHFHYEVRGVKNSVPNRILKRDSLQRALQIRHSQSQGAVTLQKVDQGDRRMDL